MSGSYCLLVLLLVGITAQALHSDKFVYLRKGSNRNGSRLEEKYSAAEVAERDESSSGPGDIASYTHSSSLSPVLTQPSDARSRVIPSSEHIILDEIPGAENIIVCSKLGELHHFWWSQNLCMVCACLPKLDQLDRLHPVCGSCGQCLALVPELPIPDTEPVTCKPMPTNTPFQNPLNPCQICVCQQIVDMYGKQKVEIECKENSQCVLPTSTLPPITAWPVPLPLCQKLPKNVWFPHPNEVCKICKCITELVLGTMEPHISCIVNPKCHMPHKPQLIPDLVNKHSPLPGPPPHETCRPFTPNQLFAHPWDSCLMCVCSELRAKGIINIEINCYTRPECCLQPETVTPAAITEWVTSLPESGKAMINGHSNTTMSSGRIHPNYSPKISKGGVQNNAYKNTWAQSTLESMLPPVMTSQIGSSSVEVNTNSGYNFGNYPSINYPQLLSAQTNKAGEIDAVPNLAGANRDQSLYPSYYQAQTQYLPNYSEGDTLAGFQGMYRENSEYSQNPYYFPTQFQYFPDDSWAGNPVQSIANLKTGSSDAYPYSYGDLNPAEAQVQPVTVLNSAYVLNPSFNPPQNLYLPVYGSGGAQSQASANSQFYSDNAYSSTRNLAKAEAISGSAFYSSKYPQSGFAETQSEAQANVGKAQRQAQVVVARGNLLNDDFGDENEYYNPYI